MQKMIECFSNWFNTTPNPNDLFFVNIRELWQAFKLWKNGKKEIPMPPFKSKRRFENDSREWVYNNDLNCQYGSIFPNADFYAIKHWLYCCASTPAFETFMEKEWLEEYISKNVKAGDLLEIWAVCVDKMKYICVKMPDENNLVPLKGAY